jgi:flavin reductase (DIM6/NTAB) family NADH-FMN oxidoreductase RutF
MKRLLGPVTAFFPTPCVLVVSGDMGLAHISMVAWAGVVNAEPPMLGISMRAQTHAYALIKRYGQFTVNIPHEGILRQTDACAMMTGITSDHFANARLTKLPSKKVASPIISESIVSLECEVHETHSLGSHTLVIGQIVEVHADEQILDQQGRIVIEHMKPVVCCPLMREYRTVGERLESYGFSKGKAAD